MHILFYKLYVLGQSGGGHVSTRGMAASSAPPRSIKFATGCIYIYISIDALRSDGEQCVPILCYQLSLLMVFVD